MPNAGTMRDLDMIGYAKGQTPRYGLNWVNTI